MAPKIEILVLSGSLFCTKVMAALEYKGLSYEMVSIHPTKLKKQTPPPHQVPVMRYDGEIIPDSQAILKYIDAKHASSTLPLYPTVTRGTSDTWATVDDLEKFAHDDLASMYYYFGGMSDYGKKNVTQPFLRSLLPDPFRAILFFMPALGAKVLASGLRKRVVPIVGAKNVANDAAAKKFLFERLNKLEKCFKRPEQKFLFDTKGPTAADFGVFAVLKRLLDPIPEIADGLTGGYPNVLKDAGDLPRLTQFFDLLNKSYYEGKIYYST